jgi:hypothetical protein
MGVYASVSLVVVISVLPPGLAITAAVLVIAAGHNSILFGQTSYPAAESGQRILLDTKSGLNKNLTKVEVQLIGPVLPILEANTTEDTNFVLVGQEKGQLSLYQYQSMFPMKIGIPMNLTRLADFDTIQDAMAEADGIKDAVKNNS